MKEKNDKATPGSDSRDCDKAQTKKLDEALDFWDYDKMLARKDALAARSASEAAYIRGLVHRATRVALGAECSVLQIAAGPCDVIDHWREGDKHAIDPLAEEYKERFHVLQDPTVKYVAGYAENMPYEDDYFDLVIIRNELDHLNDPDAALREVFRVMKPTGALYLWLYIYTRRCSLVYRLVNALTDRYRVEPWFFTLPRIERILRRNRFEPYCPAVEDLQQKLSPGSQSPLWAWSKYLIKLALGMGKSRGLRCVALPRGQR